MFLFVSFSSLLEIRCKSVCKDQPKSIHYLVIHTWVSLPTRVVFSWLLLLQYLILRVQNESIVTFTHSPFFERSWISILLSFLMSLINVQLIIWAHKPQLLKWKYLKEKVMPSSGLTSQSFVYFLGFWTIKNLLLMLSLIPIDRHINLFKI